MERNQFYVAFTGIGLMHPSVMDVYLNLCSIDHKDEATRFPDISYPRNIYVPTVLAVMFALF